MFWILRLAMQATTTMAATIILQLCYYNAVYARITQYCMLWVVLLLSSSGCSQQYLSRFSAISAIIIIVSAISAIIASAIIIIVIGSVLSVKMFVRNNSSLACTLCASTFISMKIVWNFKHDQKYTWRYLYFGDTFMQIFSAGTIKFI